MRERELLGHVLPAHKQLQPILRQVRVKYGLPNQNNPDSDLANLVIQGDVIQWEEIRIDLEAEIREDAELLPEQIRALERVATQIQAFQDNPSAFLECRSFDEHTVLAFAQILDMLIWPFIMAKEQMIEDLTELAFYYLTTGDTKEIPVGWQGAVFMMPFLGEPVVVAMAGQLSNPKEIRDKFVSEMHKQFGKDRPKVTEGMLNFASYLRQRMSGEGLAKIADAYIEDHPDEFTSDRNSPDFRDQRHRLMDRLKKALARYEERLSKLIGDKN